MKSIYILVTTIFCFTSCARQDKVVFDIQETSIDKTDAKKQKSDFIKNDSIFYQDADYIVTKTCSGEWGGSIWFKSKKTGITYSCQSTCPKSINKINNKYIVTSSLAHMSGSSEVIRIENPMELSVFQQPKPREQENGIPIYYSGDMESKSRKGIEIIWNEFDILTYVSFYHKKTLYHIMVKEEKTYLTTISENKLVIIDLISEERIWSHNTAYKIDTNHSILYLGRVNKRNGYIEIKDNKITLVRFK